MKKLDELFKVVTWDELVDGETYYVLCTGSNWSEPSRWSGNHIYNKEKDKLLDVRDNQDYFTKPIVSGYETTIFKYLVEVE